MYLMLAETNEHISRLQAILISRFLLNLRQTEEPATSHESHLSRFSMPNFRMPTIASITGDMGNYLDHGNPEIEDDIDNANVEVDVDVEVDVNVGEGPS